MAEIYETLVETYVVTCFSEAGDLGVLSEMLRKQ